MILSKQIRLLIAVSVTILALVSLARAENCTHTIGFWKNTPGDWPSMQHTLGRVGYAESQSLSILFQPVQGNGLVSLAQQLIAAKLNIAMGADSDAIAETIEAADRLIGSLVVPPIGDDFLAPSRTSVLTAQLDAFNRGDVGPGHCDFANALDATTWGQVKSLYR